MLKVTFLLSFSFSFFCDNFTNSFEVYSNRTYNGECVNDEGANSIHMSDGVLNIYQTGISNFIIFFVNIIYIHFEYPFYLIYCRRWISVGIPCVGLAEDTRSHMCYRGGHQQLWRGKFIFCLLSVLLLRVFSSFIFIFVFLLLILLW